MNFQLAETLKNPIGFEFSGETTKRKEKWQYPLPAIRELLLNAVVHRDYTNPTDVIIKIFDEKIEITNPGRFNYRKKSSNYVSGIKRPDRFVFVKLRNFK